MANVAWVALGLLKHVGRRTMTSLMRHFDNDPHAVLNASIDELLVVPGIGAKTAAAIRGIRLKDVEAAMQQWEHDAVALVTLEDKAYPPALRTVADAPPLLFVRGTLPPPKGVALVGTRKPSSDAARWIALLSEHILTRGFAVISGLAFGIDTVAHETTLTFPQGRTVAVLGSGVCNVYPPEHRELSEAIIRRGALVCEVNPYAEVSVPALVARNRIITGLSDAVVIVETSAEGGAMHAARFARWQGRRLYALDIAASGNRTLIDSGAAIPIPPDLRGFEGF